MNGEDREVAMRKPQIVNSKTKIAMLKPQVVKMKGGYLNKQHTCFAKLL